MDAFERQLTAAVAREARLHEAVIDTRCITKKDVQEHLLHTLDMLFIVANGVEMEEELVHVFSLHFDIMVQCLYLGLDGEAFSVLDAVLTLKACHFGSSQALIRCIRKHSLFALEVLMQIDGLETDFPIITFVAACMENDVPHIWCALMKELGLVPYIRDAALSHMQTHVIPMRLYSYFLMDDNDLDKETLYHSMVREVAIESNGLYQLVLEEAVSLQPVYSSLHLIELNSVYSSIDTELIHAIALLSMQNDEIASLILKSVDWKASSLTISRHVLRAFTSQDVIGSSLYSRRYKEHISAGMFLLSIYIRESRYFKQAEELFYEYLVMVILCLYSGNVRLIDTVSQLIRTDESLFRVLTHDGFTLQRLDSKLSGAFLSLLKEHKLTFNDEQKEFENIGKLAFSPQVLFSTLEEVSTSPRPLQRVYTPSHCIELAVYLIQCGQSGTFTMDAMLQLVRPSQSPSFNRHIIDSVCTLVNLNFNYSLVASLVGTLAQLDANPAHRDSQMVLIQWIEKHVSAMDRGSQFTFFAEAVFFKLCRSLKQALEHKDISFGEQLLQPMKYLYHACGPGFSPITSTIFRDVIALDLISTSTVYIETTLLDEDFSLLFQVLVRSRNPPTKAVLRVLNQVKERTTEQHTRRSIPVSWSPYVMQLSQLQLDHVKQTGQPRIAYITPSVPLLKANVSLKEAIGEAIAHTRHPAQKESTSGIVASAADMKSLGWILGLLKQELLYGSQQVHVIDHICDSRNIHLLTQLYASGCNGGADLMMSFIESIHTCILVCLSRGTLSQTTIDSVQRMVFTLLALPSAQEDLIYNVLKLVLTMQSYCEVSTFQLLTCLQIETLITLLEQPKHICASLSAQLISRLLAYIVATESVRQHPEGEAPLKALVHHATAVQELLMPVDLRDAFLRAHCQERLGGEPQTKESVFLSSVLLCTSLEHSETYIISVSCDWIHFRRKRRYEAREREESELSVRFDAITWIEMKSTRDESIMYWDIEGKEHNCRILFPSEIDAEQFVMYVSSFMSVHENQQGAAGLSESRVQVVQEGSKKPLFSLCGYLGVDCSAASRCVLKCIKKKDGKVIEMEPQGHGTFLSFFKRSSTSFSAEEIQNVHMKGQDGSVSLIIELPKGHKTVYFPSTLACSRCKTLLKGTLSSPSIKANT